MASKWEPHKRQIKELFIDQKKTLDEVKYLMEMKHGFSASKTEYERRLKKWNFKKNIDTNVVKFIKVKLEERKRQSKDVEAYFRGVPIPKLEIQKKANRCYVSVPERHQLMRCTTPPGLMIVTPASEYYMSFIRSKDLPWIYFQKQLNKLGNLDNILDMSGQIMRAMIPCICPAPSPLVDLHVKQILHYLCVIMPVGHDGNVIDMLQKIFGGDYRLATTEFLKLVVYLLSNKLLSTISRTDPGTILCDKLLEWFQMGHNHSILQDILSNKTPTIEVFMESIFSSAVYVEDPVILNIFLRSGIDPDIKIFDREFCYCTPLQCVAQRGNLALVEMFLDAGGNINLCGDTNDFLDEDAPLEIASRTGNYELARFLISRGAAVNHSDDLRLAYEGSSPLQNSALAGSLEIASLLLDNGARVDANQGDYGSPLECAIRAEAIALVDLLLERGADVNCLPGKYGNTPLQSAAMIRNHSSVKRLLGLGADVNSPAAQWGGKTATALIFAVMSKNYAIVKLLLESGAHVNAQLWEGYHTALEVAAGLGNTEIVRLLLLAGANPGLDTSITEAIRHVQDLQLIATLIGSGDVIRNPTSYTENALCAAVETNNLNLIQMLLAAGACPNARRSRTSKTALAEAVHRGNLPIIEALIGAGAIYKDSPSPFEYGLNPLQTACRKGNIDLARYFIDIGADVNCPAAESEGRTALQAAVESEDIEFVQFLITKRAELNAPPSKEHGTTALQAAIQNRKIDLIQLLLDAGACANDTATRYDYLSSLQLAAKLGDDILVQLLLDYGADVNWPAADFGGRTALQATSEEGQYTVVRVLLTNGADINAPACQASGFTALQAAAYSGYLRIAKVLLEKGADVNALGSDNFGFTALESAAMKGHIDMLKLLLNAGADITETEKGRQQLRML